MKRIIYILFAIAGFLAASCKKKVVDVQDFGKVVIDSISPGSGPSNAYLVIYGKNFSYLTSDVEVTINQVKASVIESSLTRLLIYIPAGATTGPLHCSFNRRNPSNEKFDYSGQVQPAAEGPVFVINESQAPMPIIKSVEPRQGKAGDNIIIKGYNFSAAGNCCVLFGAIAGEIVSINPTEVQVKVPMATPGTVALTLQQGNYLVNAGMFEVQETPKGVREVYFVEGSGTSRICKAVFDNSGNATIHVLYDATDGVTASDYGIKADVVNGAIYWIDGTTIKKGSTDGSLPPVILYTDPVFLIDLDLDAAAGKLYFSSWSSSMSGHHSIKRINTDGSGTAEELYQLSNEPMPGCIKVNPASGKIYWAEGMSSLVMEGSVNGHTAQAAKVLFDPSDGIGAPVAIAISPSTAQIFIVDLGNTGLYAGALDGTGPLTKIPLSADDMGYPADIEIDDANQFIYWQKLGPDYVSGELMRCKTNGTSSQSIIATGMQYVTYLDIVL
jgi:hypothetical protein